MMDVEITEYPNHKYDSIRIPSLDFVGLIDWATDKRFGIAAGVVMATNKKLLLYFLDGSVAWSLTDCTPMDIRFADDGWGYFMALSDICVFAPSGLVFRSKHPMGFAGVRSIRFFNDRVMFDTERFKFTYDFRGNLLEQLRDEARLFVDELPDNLRWDRFNKAEELLGLARNGNAEAAEDAKKLLNICKRQFGDYLNVRARCYRFLGDLAVLEGDENKAIEQWRTALKADKKVGVKRELSMLEKKLEKH